MTFLRAALVCAVLLGYGCGDDGEGPPMPPPPGAELTVSRMTVAQNPTNALSFFVTWETDVAAPTELSVDCGPDYQQRFSDGVSRTQHEVFVMGLFEGASCTFTAHPDTIVAGEATETVNDVGPLPSSLPELSVNMLDEGGMQPGWTLFSLAQAFREAELIVVAVDPQGRYRWMYSPGTGGRGVGAELQVTDEGVLIGAGDPYLLTASWEGELLWRVDQVGHHDLRLSPWNDGHVLFLGINTTGCGEHTGVEYDLATQEAVWEWPICEHWTPPLQYSNWSHLNTIEPVPGERAVLISSRDQDALFKVNRDTDEVEWVLGRNGDFVMEDSALFLRQHAPEFLSNGNILLIDNGILDDEASRTLNQDELNQIAPGREYTRVLEFALTFDAQGNPDRADLVWEYTDESIFAVNRSEADRLPNGNTLMHYVYVQPGETLNLREVTVDNAIVWDITAPMETASYRSERIEPYYGHVVAE